MPSAISEKSSLNKHARLTDSLRRQIQSGELRPGDRLPSISEFRTQHGVTLTTVEKVLSALEREGMIERLHGKGVFVIDKRKQTRCLGFVSLRQGTSAWELYWVRFLDGVREGAHAAGYNILLIDPLQTNSWEDQVDGALFHEMIASDYPQFRVQTSVNVLSSVVGHSSIVADEYGGAYQAVRHLLDLGHRSIGYLLDDSYWATRMRLMGYQAAFREAKLKASPDWVRIFEDHTQGKQWTAWGKSEMRDWLANGWSDLGCTALLCHNDEVAMGVMETVQEHGIRIPEDLSLVGYDGTILCETSQPKLTSIKVPLREIGLRAASLMIEQIESGKPDVVTLSLPTTLQLRGSTSRLADITL